MIRKFLLFFVALILFLFFNEVGVWNWMSLKRMNNQLKAQIENQKNYVQILEIEIDSLETNLDYLKKIAQEKYGMVKRGQRLITIIDSEDKK